MNLFKKVISGALAISLAAASFSGIAKANESENYDTFFLVPHPDDELLSMGSAIINHNFYGDNNVHLVLLTGGEQSNVFHIANGEKPCPVHGYIHSPSNEGYAPFDRQKFKEGKFENFKHVAYMLGVKPQNVHIYDFGDGDVTQEEVEGVIKDLSAKHPKNRWKSLSYHDNHPDHANSGKALLKLVDEGLVKDARFYAKKSMVESGLWSNTTTTTFKAERTNPDWEPYITAGIRAYSDWNPKKGYYHAGKASVSNSFIYLEKDMTNYYHFPHQ
jgi:LmbE family N-acetylglucosaminyl deacetylase